MTGPGLDFERVTPRENSRGVHVCSYPGNICPYDLRRPCKQTLRIHCIDCHIETSGICQLHVRYCTAGNCAADFVVVAFDCFITVLNVIATEFEEAIVVSCTLLNPVFIEPIYFYRKLPSHRCSHFTNCCSNY